MNSAFDLFSLGVVFGFGLSVLVSLVGSAIGRTLALFDVG